MTVILGAGLAGLSTSFHLQHQCRVFDKNKYAGGHIFSHEINGFTWDEGPHVSFTKHQYVKDLFADSLDGDFLEYPVYPTNYYKGSWIPHPAQTNLYAVPEPTRSECLQSFLQSRSTDTPASAVSNYKQWLTIAFGEKFTETFPSAYTLKYWTVSPENLTTDWVGNRVFYPQVKDVEAGFQAPLAESKHYITSVRYPRKGGYNAFATKLRKEADIHLQKEVKSVDLLKKIIHFTDGGTQAFSRLINTIPLPEFMRLISAPEDIMASAAQLSCSEVLLLNFEINHPAPIPNQWMYVYDLDKFSCRINFTDLLSPFNGQPNKCGIQVEVYFSKYRPQTDSLDYIITKVKEELLEMGLVKSAGDFGDMNHNRIKFANVIFDHARREHLNNILNYLSKFGLKREQDDLEAMTNWETKMSENIQLGELVLAGRFGQWNYYWTDDCVMRGKFIAEHL
jgi:protoporphyrinogen oxidase